MPSRSWNKPSLGLEQVDVLLPDGTPLLRDVNLTIHTGESVVLRGASGTGKTTLFRVLAGLWPYGRGYVRLPSGARTLFLPQKPYLPIGTLKEVLSYPEDSCRHSDQTCREVLAACSLTHLIPRLAQTQNWSLILSGGEQQRLALPLCSFYHPDWLFLDEASSALDQPTERRIRDLLIERLPHAALISIAHTSGDPSPHTRQILIDRWHGQARTNAQPLRRCGEIQDMRANRAPTARSTAG